MPPLPAITDLSDDEPQQRGTVTTGKKAAAAPPRPPVEDSSADLEEPAPKAKATSKAKAAKSGPVTPKPKPAPKALKRPAAAKATVLKRPASEVRAYKYWCYKDKKIGIKLHGKEVTTV